MISFLRKIMAGNRRKYPRVRTEVDVVLHLVSSTEESLQVRTRNLSASGMEILLDRPLEVLTKVDVEIPLPDEEEPLRLKGSLVRSLPMRTLWNRLLSQEVRYAVGINFLDLDPALRARMIRYLQRTTR